MKLSSDAGLATEPGSDTMIFSVIYTVVNCSVAKEFQSSVFQTDVEKAVRMFGGATGRKLSDQMYHWRRHAHRSHDQICNTPDRDTFTWQGEKETKIQSI